MQFKSKSHTIQGWQFRRDCVDDKPDWLETAIRKGFAHIVVNSKDAHVVLFDKNGDGRKAYEDDWVCMNKSGTLFPLSQEEMERGFEPDDSI